MYYWCLQGERVEYWRDLTGDHPYNPDPEEVGVRAGGLQDDHKEIMQTHRSDGEYLTLDKLSTPIIFF